LIAPFAKSIYTGTPVRSIRRVVEGVEVVTDRLGIQRYDKVIVAAHGDQALRLLSDPTPLEAELLGAFRYQANEVDLHSDERFMPGERRCWASWNYRSDRLPDGS